MSLWNCVSIKEFTLGGNLMGGMNIIEEIITYFPQLETFELFCRVDPNILQSLHKFKYLEKLNLQLEKYDYFLPLPPVKLKTIKNASISFTSVLDSDLSRFVKWFPNVEKLSLFFDCKPMIITNTVCEISKLSHLRVLNFCKYSKWHKMTDFYTIFDSPTLRKVRIGNIGMKTVYAIVEYLSIICDDKEDRLLVILATKHWNQIPLLSCKAFDLKIQRRLHKFDLLRLTQN
ncbi:hypothetical protein B4U79_16200 [Dinothrombium tinctorium]|uniref:Uncharacterized protein n=1 Tax=Dinothrombium tinctorium TaxID=1965070 RepID=A0A3S3RV93_9ACAR|nr:hypothetical protein B4U79_16483 [Dinothrombium tinctorium]RWS06501.1 hypothetical protein B4U79_16206 [Dinothrombium tinctorium]RWS06544.1 hypothetical protein B4U79_16200 [Dinothrombium tinctorium]